MALKDAVTTVLNRNAYYRDGYRLLLRISVIQGIIITLLVGGLVSLLLSMDTRQVYFATTSDGRIIEIVPVNESYQKDAFVVSWAAREAKKIMRFGYHDYKPHMQDVFGSFTVTGRESFMRALDESKIRQLVEARKLIVTMDVLSAPEIRSKGVDKGVYTWFLQFPVVIRFEGAEAPPDMNVLLILQITRVSTLQNPDGISIEQWIAKLN